MTSTSTDCFRTYDIRAIVGDDFNAVTYRQLGRAYVRWLKERQEPSLKSPSMWVAVGHDARLHSPELSKSLIQGLTISGVSVVDLGLCPTPAVYFTEHYAEHLSGVPSLMGTLIVTGSHNAAKYNGLKMTFQKQALSPKDVQDMKGLFSDLSETDEQSDAEVICFEVIPHYVEYLAGKMNAVKAPVKVVVDAGNATGGLVAPELFRRLGCEVTELFCEPDGYFPNHHPDPCKHENLRQLSDCVRTTKADFGIAFDGDSDRLGVVDNNGEIIPGDILLLMFAEALLEQKPSATVVSEVKCSQVLFDRIAMLGGKAIMAPTGNAFIKKIMSEENAELGGELSGHFFFRDQHFGFDDAFYAALRFLEIVVTKKRKTPGFEVSSLGSNYPASFLSEEQRVECPRPRMENAIHHLSARLPDALEDVGINVLSQNPLDGIRLTFRGGFLLVRPSNTEPCLTIRYETPDEDYGQLVEDILARELPAACHID